MVRLKNIVRTDTQISTDYYPEDDQESGHIVMNLENGEVVEWIRAPSDSVVSMCFPHVRNILERLSRLQEVPSECTEMWY